MTLSSWFHWKIRRLYIRMVHEKASPEYIARGWAIGVFYGFLLPMGIQLPISLATSFFFKGSKIGATIGTFVSNHLTVFVLYPVQCFIGCKVLQLASFLGWNIKARFNMSYAEIEEAVFAFLHEYEPESLGSLAFTLLLTFFIGSAILAAIMTPLTYVLVRRFVIRGRIAHASKRRIPFAERLKRLRSGLAKGRDALLTKVHLEKNAAEQKNAADSDASEKTTDAKHGAE